MPFNRITRTLIFTRKKALAYNCHVCQETVLLKKSLSGRRFGILENCNHVFCIHCLQEHVRLNIEYNKIQFGYEGKKLLNASISCPVCNLPSSFILSSYKPLLNINEKDIFVKEFQTSLSMFLCPFLKGGIPTCFCEPGHCCPEPYALFTCFRNY